MLRPVVARTWNQLSVDGDTSTNDTVFLVASGASGAAASSAGSAGMAALGAAVEAVGRDLARQQAADGEGATTLLTCQVTGARDDAEARAVARAVVSSSLVKAAIHGRDPNWGRIADALGNAQLADAAVLEAAGLPADEAAARARSRSTSTRTGCASRSRPSRVRRRAGAARLRPRGRSARRWTPRRSLIRVDLGRAAVPARRSAAT